MYRPFRAQEGPSRAGESLRQVAAEEAASASLVLLAGGRCLGPGAARSVRAETGQKIKEAEGGRDRCRARGFL